MKVFWRAIYHISHFGIILELKTEFYLSFYNTPEGEIPLKTFDNNCGPMLEKRFEFPGLRILETN